MAEQLYAFRQAHHDELWTFTIPWLFFTKAELAELLFDNVGLNKREAKDMVEAFFEVIRDALESGDSVKLSGFGNFQLRDKPQRPGRNHQGGRTQPVGDHGGIDPEDAKELVLDRHPNHVRLFYSKDDQGLARASPKQLLECCLRMKPDRILLAELRSEEAFDYLRNVNSGHPGSITSVHATSAELAFEQLVLLVKQSPGGRELARQDIKSLLYLLVDVVIQFGVERHQRYIKEIWYEPARKRRGLSAAAAA